MEVLQLVLLVLLVAAVAYAVAWVEKWKHPPQRSAEYARLPVTGKYFQEVVGESHYQAAIKAAVRRGARGDQGVLCDALLIPESNNRFDADAVGVWLGGALCGYLPANEARLFRARLKKAGRELVPHQCPAIILGGGEKSYGIWLDLPANLKADSSAGAEA